MKKYKLIPHNGEIIVVEAERNILREGDEIWVVALANIKKWEVDIANKDIDRNNVYKVISRGVTNSLDDLLKLQREKEANFAAQEKYHIPQNGTCGHIKSTQILSEVFSQGYLAALDSHPFTTEDMVEFQNWKEKGNYVATGFNYRNEKTFTGGGKVYSAKELLDIYLTETALSRLKESDVEIMVQKDNPEENPNNPWNPLLTDGKVTITKFI